MSEFDITRMFSPFMITKNIFMNEFGEYYAVPLIFGIINPDLYLIYPTGEIYSKLFNKIMKQDTNHAGYKRICLINSNGSKLNYSVHRLVASTFIVNSLPELYTDVNHIDGNKSNNFYLNLEWCTNNRNKELASENGLYQHDMQRYNSKYSDDFINEICSLFQNGYSYEEVRNIYNIKTKTDPIGYLIYNLYHKRTHKHITKNYNY